MSATEVAEQDEIGGGAGSDGFVLGGAFAKMIGKISNVKKDETETAGLKSLNTLQKKKYSQIITFKLN